MKFNKKFIGLKFKGGRKDRQKQEARSEDFNKQTKKSQPKRQHPNKQTNKTVKTDLVTVAFQRRNYQNEHQSKIKPQRRHLHVDYGASFPKIFFFFFFIKKIL